VPPFLKVLLAIIATTGALTRGKKLVFEFFSVSPLAQVLVNKKQNIFSVVKVYVFCSPLTVRREIVIDPEEVLIAMARMKG
jgi:hypothetical protein